MLDFLIVWAAKDLPQVWDSAFTKKLKDVRPVQTDTQVFWQPPLAENTYIWLFGTEVAPYKLENQFAQDINGLSFFNGWVMPSLGRAPIRRVSELKGEIGKLAKLYGEYAYVNLDNRGDGFIRRNDFATSQIYYHASDDLVIIGSRAGLVSAMLRHDLKAEVNLDFARWACSAGIGLNHESLYAGVKLLPQGAGVSFAGGKPSIKFATECSLQNDDLLELYANHPTRYWDECFAKLTGLMNVVDATDAPLDLTLNGSKDVRLIFALLNKVGYAGRINNLSANGADYSPDVRAAKMLAEHYNMKLEVKFSPKAPPTVEPLVERMAIHMKIAEGELSPLDMFWRAEVKNALSLPLQEVGLRNISGKTMFKNEGELRKWFGLHFAGGDNLGVLRAEMQERNIAEINAYIDDALASGVGLNQIPTKHRLQLRMAHWNARLWGANNSIGFAPNLLTNEEIVAYSYNAGAKSRATEEFYFEMLRRCDEKLLEIPFTNVGWDKELLAQKGVVAEMPEPLKWEEGGAPANMKPTQLAVYNHFETIKSVIVENINATNGGNVISELVDLAALTAMKVSDVKAGHLPAIWQLLQISCYYRTTDMSNISTAKDNNKLLKINNFADESSKKMNANTDGIRNISILGSCVSRDIFDLAPLDNVRIAKYVARSSLVSMFSPKLLDPTSEMLESTKWRDRMQVLDLNKGGIEYLFSEECDFMVIDLIDERLGIITDGVAATSIAPFVNDEEFMAEFGVGFKKSMPFHKGYFELWQVGLAKFVALVRQKNMEEKIILNKIFLGSCAQGGNVVAGISIDFVEKMNVVLGKMYDEFERLLPNCHKIEYGETDLFVDAEHRWGAAPFHYDLLTYQHASKAIAQMMQ